MKELIRLVGVAVILICCGYILIAIRQHERTHRNTEEDLKTLFYRAVFLHIHGPNGSGLSIDEAFDQLGVVDPADRDRLRDAIGNIPDNPETRALFYRIDLTIANAFIKSRHGSMSSVSAITAGGT